jgi:hypothetical protein
MFVIPDNLMRQIILGIEADAGLVDPHGSLLHLYTNNLTPTPANVLGDFVELTGGQVPGYVATDVGVDALPNRQQDSTWTDYLSFALIYATSAPPVPVTVYGGFITDNTGAVLKMSFRFAAPVTFTEIYDGVTTSGSIQAAQQESLSASFRFNIELFEPAFAAGGGPIMMVVPDVLMSGLITAIEGVLGTAATGLVNVHLYTNVLTPTKNNVLGDFTELTNVEVPGYATKSANWFAGVPFRRQDGAWESPSSLVDPDFVATGPPPGPISVYGFFATDSTNAILLGSGAFTVPFTFVQTGDGLTLSGNPALLQQTGLQIQLQLQDLQPS